MGSGAHCCSRFWLLFSACELPQAWSAAHLGLPLAHCRLSPASPHSDLGPWLAVVRGVCHYVEECFILRNPLINFIPFLEPGEAWTGICASCLPDGHLFDEAVVWLLRHPGTALPSRFALNTSLHFKLVAPQIFKKAWFLPRQTGSRFLEEEELNPWIWLCGRLSPCWDPVRVSFGEPGKGLHSPPDSGSSYRVWAGQLLGSTQDGMWVSPVGGPSPDRAVEMGLTTMLLSA